MKFGAVQLQDIQGNIPVAIATIKQALETADRDEIHVLCFPECFLQGYTLDEDVTKARALDINSSEFRTILKEFSKFKTTAIIGIIEEDAGRFFNTAVVLKDGNLIGKYRKTHLFEKNFSPGVEHPLFLAEEVPFGINICYDARFAEGAIALAEQGAKLIFYLLNNRLPVEKANAYRDKHIQNLIDRAKDTSCWIVSSDVVASSNNSVGYGCTAIVSPLGEVVSRVTELETGIITAEYW